MISFLSGKVLHKGAGYVIILVNGIGYKVVVGASYFAELEAGRSTEIYTYHHVREDSAALYGFKAVVQLEMFELLLTISGIGPKSALAVLSIAEVDDLRESIARGDSSLLVKVSGIGRKTAERIVLELRDKIIRLLESGRTNTNAYRRNMIAGGDEIDALVALGYSLSQARDALSKVGADIKDSGERIKEALKRLGK